MARKVFVDEPVSAERWMVSYADLMTLLFALFVVLYAISSLNESKYRVLSNSIGSAFGGLKAQEAPANSPQATASGQTPAVVPKEQAAETVLRQDKDLMTGMARDIHQALTSLVSQGKVKVTQSARGISVEINSSVLFAPGQARLNDEALTALVAVAQVMKQDNHQIQVEGHTDNVPIDNLLFPSNWELSAVRAGSVIRVFIDQGIAEKRVTAVGRASTRPVASNSTPEGRQRNRRVEVLLLAELPDTPTDIPLTP